jgi:hypothetical protein
MNYFAGGLVVGSVAISVACIAPASAKQIGAFKDWSAYSEGKAKARTCWIYSEPVKDEGKYKKRGRIYMLVTHRPGEKTSNQVQFTAGYTFKKGSAVQVVIGKKKFELFTNDDTAWARSTKDDKSIVAAMRGGARMIVTGQSSRGTKTKDTYSLAGIFAAHRAISKACGIK